MTNILYINIETKKVQEKGPKKLSKGFDMDEVMMIFL
jgi:hypothetical protein